MRAWVERGWKIGTLVLMLSALAAGLLRPQKNVWPFNAQWHVEPFSDEVLGGQSRTVGFCTEDGVLSTRFVLSNLPTRSAGLSLRVVSQGVDCSGCSNLQLQYRTLTKDPLRLQIQVEEPEFSQKGTVFSNRFLFCELPPSLTWRKWTLPLSTFETPDWWYRQNFVPPGEVPPPSFHRVLKVAVCESEFTPPWKTLGVEVRSLRFEGAWWPTILLLCLVPVPWLLHRLLTPRFPARPYGQPLKVPVRQEAEFERLAACIAEHFPDPDFDLATLCRKTGIAEGRVPSILEKQSGLRFKPYLNQVRIQEAARLLIETELTVGEIAFQVGYSNTTHFNRVFKSLKSCVPSDFRAANRKA